MPETKKTYKGKVRGVKSKAPEDKILLKKFETLTLRELGEEYGVTPNTVSTWLRNARLRQGG